MPRCWTLPQVAKLVRTLLLTSCVVLVGDNLFATTYYIDYGSGSDSNNGTSKASPWQNAPGMQTCASLCNSTIINGGDSIILKGGVTWPNASFMWALPGGATGNPVYIGVDKTWYAGTSWARPILSPGGIVIGNNYNTMFSVPANVTIDNFEITGFYWTTASCGGAPYGDCGIFNAGQRNGQTWENLYIHGWTHAGTNAVTSNGVIDIIATGGGGNSVAHDNIIVGTDVPGDHSVNVFFNGPPIAYNNYVKQVSSAFIVSYASSVHDNHIEDIGPSYCNMPFPEYAGNCSHENAFEDNGDTGLYFYNNVITNVSAGLALWIAPNPGYSAAMWNNVIYAIHDNQVLDLAPAVYSSTYCSSGATSNGYCTTGGAFVFENNTVECGDDTTQYDGCHLNIGAIGSGSTAQSVLFQNNHIIALTTESSCATGAGEALSCTFAPTNLVQTLSQANSQGYNSSQTYAFSPTASGNSTVGAGSSLTSSAVGNSATLGADTTYSCTIGSGNQPACPARTTVNRPSTGAWDAGAYEFRSGGPSPPIALTATVQ
jgi:hypothetical protein